MEPTRNPKVIYTDNSLELGKSSEKLSWNHCTPTPHRSETNGIAERAVRRAKEGTSAVLLQSGLGNEWWADSMNFYCYLRNMQDLSSDGETPYERRFGMLFNGPVIPFGAVVEYHLISAKELSRLHQFGAKVLPGVFLGYVLSAERNLERRHYGRRHWRIGGDGRIRIPRPKAQCKGSVNAAKKWKLHIPSRRWNSTNLWRSTASENIRLNRWTSGTRRRTRKEEQEIIQGKSDELHSPTQLQDDSTRDDEEAESDFWTIPGELIYRHHVVPRVKLYVTSEETFPIPLKYIDVTRKTYTFLDVLLEKISKATGTWMVKKSWLTHGQDSQDLLCWTKGHRMDVHGLGGD